jgi:hypothetical protein
LCVKGIEVQVNIIVPTARLHPSVSHINRMVEKIIIGEIAEVITVEFIVGKIL